MKRVVLLLCILSTFMGLQAASDTFIDYQNYNHGYCPECNSYPCQCDTGYYPNVIPSNQPPYPQDPPPCPPACNTCPNQCDPSAPACSSTCGVSICAIAVAIIAVVVAAVIIVSSGNGS